MTLFNSTHYHQVGGESTTFSAGPCSECGASTCDECGDLRNSALLCVECFNGGPVAEPEPKSSRSCAEPGCQRELGHAGMHMSRSWDSWSCAENIDEWGNL